LRAAADLRQLRIETQVVRAEAEKQRDVIRQKIERGNEIVGNAEAVVALTITAYREGEMSLPDVLQARRTARDAIRAYILNLESMRAAEAAVTRALFVGGAIPGTTPTLVTPPGNRQ
jgi:outer membrane protein TolC